MKKKLVVFTGAGMSAESGLSTFRDNDGLWEKYAIEDVATPEAWQRNPSLVLDFYNARRTQLKTSHPNAAHLAIVELEDYFDVHVITQNVDNLHERAGSTKVLHLHGELTKACNSSKSNVIDVAYNDICIGDKLDGEQVRPFIVWFGEDVPAMDKAIRIANLADFFVVIGTSLNVYPAASLLDFVPKGSPIYLIDPNANKERTDVYYITEVATEGMRKLKDILRSE